MKTKEELKPNYAPVYAASLYPELARIFHRHGYALAVHGSVARDFDLIAIPWAEMVSGVNEVLTEVTSTFAIRICGDRTVKNHGRFAYTLAFCGECAVDLSFFEPASRVKELEARPSGSEQQSLKECAAAGLLAAVIEIANNAETQ